MTRSAVRVLVLVLVPSIFAVTSGAADPRADAVYERVAARLALMKPVAAWKRANGVAVEDLEREAVVLERSTADAAAAGIAAETAAPFFQAQIEAAKEIQRCWLDRWKDGKEPMPETTPDLVTEIRPRLLEIGGALLSEAQAALEDGATFDETGGESFAARVDVDCLSPATRDVIYQRLAGLRLAD
jgi:chorismate mutase